MKYESQIIWRSIWNEWAPESGKRSPPEILGPKFLNQKNTYITPNGLKLEAAKPQLDRMRKLLFDINENPNTSIFVSANWREPEGEHDTHSFPVLNTVLFDGGTQVRVKSLHYTQIPENAFLYMPAECDHSPDFPTKLNIHRDRLTIAIF